MSRPTATVLTGSGRYADPWHPFPETTEAVVWLLDEAGYDVSVREDVDDALTAVDLPELLVVNVGLPRDGCPSPSAAASEGLTRYLRNRRPILGMHVSSTSFTDSPEWETGLGGRWVRGVSMHPEQSVAVIRVKQHPVTREIHDFTVFDERYSYLRVAPDVSVLATHEHEGLQHPVVWLREPNSTYGRAAYDALGHDARSFASTEHIALVRRLIEWLGENNDRSAMRRGSDADRPSPSRSGSEYSASTNNVSYRDDTRLGSNEADPSRTFAVRQLPRSANRDVSGLK